MHCFPLTRNPFSADGIGSLLLVSSVGISIAAGRVDAYVGPGAGFALAGSFWTFLILIIAALSIVVLPVLFVVRRLRQRKVLEQGTARRVVVIGLDGFDPQLASRWIEEGRLPNLKKLADTGTFSELRTTLPALTPSAWTSFMTGVDPSRHNIYDFITRDPLTYQPLLSSVEIKEPNRKLRLGKYQIPLGKPRVRSLRKSQPFWKILGEEKIFSSIIRMPITFPPEKFKGLLLAGMCVPDLRGTQGEFFFITSNAKVKEISQGKVVHLELHQRRGKALLTGPVNPLRWDGSHLQVNLAVEVNPKEQSVTLKVGKHRIELQKGEYSHWTELIFKAGLGIRVRGICRFYLIACEPLELYVTPIQIDPESPNLPLSHPTSYVIYLTKRLGKFGTLGLVEDTEALNAGILDEEGFLKQSYLLHEEREKMLFHALEKNREGLVICVFDGPDRIQHMFFRTLDPDHPANQAKEIEAFSQVIPDLYRRMDELVGRVMEKIGDDPQTVLQVVSDHGFSQFRRGVNLNTWLYENGYLFLKDDEKRRGEWLADVDWGRTRAFALGLSGLFINRQGREKEGIVPDGEELELLKAELISKLSGLFDEEKGQVAINQVWDKDVFFSGPYKADAPDLLVGYNEGYRISWSGASGAVTDRVFEDNTKSWSGDHCIDPRLVPGVLFCNRKIYREAPDLTDLPVSILRLFGVEVPAYMKGRDLFEKEEKQDSQISEFRAASELVHGRG